MIMSNFVRKSVKKRKISVKGEYRDGLYFLYFSLDNHIIVIGSSDYNNFQYEENLTNKINNIFHSKTLDYVYCSEEDIYEEIEKFQEIKKAKK